MLKQSADIIYLLCYIYKDIPITVSDRYRGL